jgi:asparagine synthase (glutamine-hydrolysing)
MCGIAGIAFPHGKRVPSELIQRMTETLRHRGPDDSGIFLDDNIGLGHRRLSIIDLSPNGHQPMRNEDGSIWTVFNGEIYNFNELRDGLVARGHQIRSQTDTEVLLHLYEEQQSEMVERLNGMFAFAIWDRPRRRLFLARDRLGIKPLFYAQTNHGFAFGSEIKAILAAVLVDRRVRLDALYHYLSLNYLPAPLTMFEGIQQLRPGEWLIWKDGRVQTQTYWRLPVEIRPLAEAEAITRFDELLQRSVRGQMLSDVPVGAFLSGGLDSSTLACYMKGQSASVKTFSIGFREETYDEAPFARKVARHLGTEHREEFVTPDARQILNRMVYHAEEPTADASMIAVWYLSQMTRKHVTVALSGDGADELLAGYETYQANILAQLYRRFPAWMRTSVFEPLVRALPTGLGKLPLDYKLKRFIAAAHLPPERAHFSWRIIFDERLKQSLLTSEVRKAIEPCDTFDVCREYFGRGQGLNEFLAADTLFYLPNDMLTKVDRMSMAHSLEVRVPYLDHELVEFLATLPPELKLRRFFTKKYLMKRLMRGRLPQDIIDRSKAGFNVPLNRWFKGELREYVHDMLSPAALSRIGFFEARMVERLLHEHQGGRADWSYQIYCLLVFAIWHQTFIESRDPFSAPRTGD